MKGQPVWRDGVKIGVVRPLDPQRAIARARELIGRGTEGVQAFHAMLDEQPYVYLGLLGQTREAPAAGLALVRDGPAGTQLEVRAMAVSLDDDNNVLGLCEAGDSFIDAKQYRRFPRAPSCLAYPGRPIGSAPCDCDACSASKMRSS